MRNNTIVGMLKWMTVSFILLIGNISFSQQVKLPTDTTFSENLRMDPARNMNPGESFDLYFDMTGFAPGTIYTALMHIDDEEIPMGHSTGSPMHVTVPSETIPGMYGIKVVAVTGLPPQPKTVLVRDSLKYDPTKWTSVNGNATGQLLFNGTGNREATLKPVNMVRGGYLQIDFNWLNQPSNSANSAVLVQYSTNNGTTWTTSYTIKPNVNYQSFLHIDLPKGAASDKTMVRFIQPNHTAGDAWKMNLVLETEYGNVVMPDYYENIHFRVNGNAVIISPLANRTICAGEQIDVSYTTKGAYASDNVFIAQLSDKDGFFSSPIEIGKLASTKSGTIKATLPDTLVSGIRYKIRIIGVSGGKTNTTSKSTPPLELGSVNGGDLTKNGNTLTAPVGTAYQWYNGTTLIAGQTGQTLTVTQSGDYYCMVTNNDGCKFKTGAVPVTIQATAIKDAENNYFKVFPNPTNDRIMLSASNEKLSGRLEYKVINVYGQTVAQKITDGYNGADLEIQLGGFEEGIYYIIIQNNDLTIVKSIVKK